MNYIFITHKRRDNISNQEECHLPVYVLNIPFSEQDGMESVVWFDVRKTTGGGEGQRPVICQGRYG